MPTAIRFITRIQDADDYAAAHTWAGAHTFNQNVTLADTKYLLTDGVLARDAGGLLLGDDAGYGLFVKDGGYVGLGTTSPAYHFHITDANINTTEQYIGQYLYHVKTAGVTDASDDMFGINNTMLVNQAGGTVGSIFGLDNRAKLLNGTATNIYGLINRAIMDGGSASSAYGLFNLADLNVGTLSGDVLGAYTAVDQSAGQTVQGNAFGHQINLNLGGSLTGSGFTLHLSSSGADFGIWQATSTTPNYFAGKVGIGTYEPGSILELNLDTEDLEIVDAGSTGATQQDWIEVQVGGVTGYLHVHAAK